MTPERAAEEERAARSYAERIWLMDSMTPEQWRDFNQSIIDRLSITALVRIKARAWQIVERGR